MYRITLLHFILLVPFVFSISFVEESDNGSKWPTVGIAVLVRNKEHILPYFLSLLHDMDYPRNRLYLWFYSDHNADKSDEILMRWIKVHSDEYHGINLTTDSTSKGRLHPDERSATHWSEKRFEHVMQLRDEAIQFMRKKWADYIFMLDADVLLTDNGTLKDLVDKDFPVVAPMLYSDSIYSNFWCAMTEDFYYKRTDDYLPILMREEPGCFEVAMVHSAVLIELRRKESDALTYRPRSYSGPLDDIIAFAVNAAQNKIPLRVCNSLEYGYIPVPLDEDDSIMKEQDHLLNYKMDAIAHHAPLPLEPILEDLVVYPKPWKYGCSEIYVINLERRVERRELMELSFKELGMSVKWFKAFDGRQIDMTKLKDHSITLMPDYEDPYHKRPMKAGEVGCFLSHYFIWNEVVAGQLDTTLVLEDDIHFAPNFRNQFMALVKEVETVDWDLIYIGRKILNDTGEPRVTALTLSPTYSYWTLGYLLRLRGAIKLLAAEPLKNLLPVDEFLPIMFDKHPNTTWKSHFPRRDLVALSSNPLLVHPTHYTGQEGYISDTEDSELVTITTRSPKTEL